MFDFCASALFIKHVRQLRSATLRVPIPFPLPLSLGAAPHSRAAHLQVPLATFLLIFNVSFATFGSNLPAYSAANPHKTQLFAQLTTQFGSFAPPLTPTSPPLPCFPTARAKYFCRSAVAWPLALPSPCQPVHANGRPPRLLLLLLLLPARSPLDVVLSLQKFQTQRAPPHFVCPCGHTGVDSDLMCCWGGSIVRGRG